MPHATHSPWWSAAHHANRRPILLVRERIRRALRGWFDREGFVEVETGILQASPGNETHLHAFATELITPNGLRRPLYLHTSPEFACKKLLAAGETKIFTFAPVFRNRERGALHHPAFTMLEWYRANEPYERLMEDCAALLRVTAEAAGAGVLRHGGRTADPHRTPGRLTVAEACLRFGGIDVLATLPRGRPDRDSLAQAARAVGIRVADDDSWADIFTRILLDRIEPGLADEGATVLCEYPAQLAALARPNPSDPRVAERFELYACGVELVNAFGELTDPVEQRRRLEAEMEEKQRLYGERYPLDEDFLLALTQMPPASGAALGFDRLVMLATGADRIEQVIWTPMPEVED
ncbi:MAG TPA: EF-P lysine aminoacylase EpmA [Hyphomicrobiaceae bacterium]|nr:EF-P lysine aminoacylase EpmA [Hyphomicrobiaceae bacterium]